MVVFLCRKAKKSHRLLPLYRSALKKVQDFLREFYEELQNGRFMKFVIPRQGYGYKTVTFDNYKTCTLYTRIHAVAARVLELLTDNQTRALRSLYYDLGGEELFNNVASFTSAVKNFGLLVGLKRYQMGIAPQSRALLYGKVQFRLACNIPLADGIPPEDVTWGEWTGPSESKQVVPLTADWLGRAEYEFKVDGNVKHVLVIEKECVFRKLVACSVFLEQVPCLLVTGCGESD
jgi:DNA topoisomerase VI subunit A